jgi:hypothetical protein
MISSFARKFCSSTPVKAAVTQISRKEFNKMCLEELHNLSMPLGFGAAASFIPGAGLASSLGLLLVQDKHDPKKFITSGLISCVTFSSGFLTAPAGLASFLVGKATSGLLTKTLEPVVERNLGDDKNFVKTMMTTSEITTMGVKNLKEATMFSSLLVAGITGLLFFPLPTFGIVAISSVAYASFYESMTNILLKKGFANPKSYVMTVIVFSAVAGLSIAGIARNL